MNHPTHDLTESLQRHADGVDVSSVPSLDGIRGRATSIRRRRRALTASVAVAAVALVAPVAWGLSGSLRADDSLPPVKSEQKIRVGKQALDMNLENLPTGSADGIGWIDMSQSPWTVHPRTGKSFTVEPLQGGQVLQYAALSDGRWVVLTSQDQVLVWDSAGNVVHSETSASDSIAVDATHNNIAWVNAEGRPRVLVTNTEKPRTMNQGQDTFTGAVAIDSSTSDCTLTAAEGPQCIVVFNDRTNGPLEVVSSGMIYPLAGSVETGSTLLSASDKWTEDGIRGAYAGTDKKTGCGILDGMSSEPQPADCSRVYGTFSPDGNRITVLADSPARTHGETFGVFTLTQPKLTWWRSPAEGSKNNASIYSHQWANDTELATVVYQNGKWSMVRFNEAGQAQQVAPSVAGEAKHPVYALEVQP